jgi:hypothetical protein
MSELPEPYRRPAIDLSPVDRQWANVIVTAILPKDIVTGVGLIAAVEHSEGTVRLEGVYGNIHYLPETNMVHAFVKR